MKFVSPVIRLFQYREVRAALAYAAAGGQALHVWRPPHDGRRSCWPGAPRHFLQFRLWAHLIDYNEERLIEAACRFGVWPVRVERRGRRGQHVDLCGPALDLALAECAVHQAR
jgi:hypothetical protein